MNTNPLSSPGTTATPPRSRITLGWLVIAQGAGLLTLVPWVYLAALSALELQSRDSSAGRTLPLLLLLYPVVPIGCSIAAWRWYYTRRYAAAAVAMPVPVLVMGVLLYALYGAIL